MTAVLCVCSGNICRSPAAELLLRRRLGDLAEFSSAGTYARDGSRIPREMRSLLRADGLDGRSHRSRTLTRGLAAEADLIVCVTAAHRDFVAQLAPAAAARVVTLGELAFLASIDVPLPGVGSGVRLAGVASAVAAHRGLLHAASPADFADPYGQSRAAYAASYAEIRAAVDAIARWVRGTVGAGSGAGSGSSGAGSGAGSGSSGAGSGELSTG